MESDGEVKLRSSTAGFTVQFPGWHSMHVSLNSRPDVRALWFVQHGQIWCIITEWSANTLAYLPHTPLTYLHLNCPHFPHASSTTTTTTTTPTTTTKTQRTRFMTKMKDMYRATAKQPPDAEANRYVQDSQQKDRENSTIHHPVPGVNETQDVHDHDVGNTGMPNSSPSLSPFPIITHFLLFSPISSPNGFLKNPSLVSI